MIMHKFGHSSESFTTNLIFNQIATQTNSMHGIHGTITFNSNHILFDRTSSFFIIVSNSRNNFRNLFSSFILTTIVSFLTHFYLLRGYFLTRSFSCCSLHVRALVIFYLQPFCPFYDHIDTKVTYALYCMLRTIRCFLVFHMSNVG